MPNDAEALRALAEVYQEDDRLTDAMLLQRRAVALDPNAVGGYLQLMTRLQLMRDYKAAQRVLEQAARLDSVSTSIPVYRALLELAATGNFERVNELAEANDDTETRIGFVYYRGDLDEAIRLLRQSPEWSVSNHGEAA